MNFSLKALLLCFQISIHYTCDSFSKKKEIRAAREEGVDSDMQMCHSLTHSLTQV